MSLVLALVACDPGGRELPGDSPAEARTAAVGGPECTLLNQTACNDGNACTLDLCNLLTLTCSNQPILGCCAGPGDCNDGVVCTVDTCDLGNLLCVHVPLGACCAGPDDCDDSDACTTDTCSSGSCSNVRDPECCTVDSQCDDGVACTTDACGADNTCTNVAIPECCEVAEDCTAGACELAACDPETARCVITPDPACPDGGVDIDGGAGDDGGVVGDGGVGDDGGLGQDGGASGDGGLGPHANYTGGACRVAPGQAGGAPLGLLGALAALVGLGGAGGVVRRRRRVRATGRTALTLLVVVGVALAAPRRASAQESEARVERYPGPTGAGDLFWLERASVLGHLSPVLRVTLSFADDPLVIRDDDDEQLARVLDSQTGLFLSAGLTFLERGQLTLGVPLFLQSGTEVSADGVRTAPADRAVGDPALDLRWAFAAQGAPLELALAVTVRAPLGGAADLVGGRTWQVVPRVLMSRRLPGYGSFIGLSAGVDAHGKDRLGTLELGPALTAAVGAFAGVTSWLGFSAEVAGSTTIDDAFVTARTPVEGTLGLRFHGGGGIVIGLGVGAGLSSGIGAPDVRGLLSVAMGPEAAAPVVERTRPAAPGDVDGDGITDDRDACPTEPEDLDGFRDEDGCPDADDDADGLPDRSDECPREAEDKDGFQDDDGCPDPDNDSDGILDVGDKCPLEPEDKDGFQDDDGCPDPDNDGDGILDTVDKCPNEAETKNGTDDEDGCPDFIRVDRAVGRINLLEPVYFVTGGWNIQEQSWPMLEELARVLIEHPELGRIGIEGHTDNVGGKARNLKLSKQRAASVMKFLVGRGVEAARLEAAGFGMTRPVDSNATREGRAKNRRVEIHLLDTDVVDVTQPPPAP